MEGKVDARSLPREVLEEKRRQAHRLRKRGITRAEIGEIVGVHADTVGRWLKLSSHDLKVNRGGRKKGEGRRLTQAQENRLRRLISDKVPDQLKLNHTLWTRKAVMELIEQETGIRMPIRTVGGYLKRWGFTPKKSVKRACEQNPKAVQRWLDEDYPVIEAKAKEEKAEINWGDEMGVRSDGQHERGYAPKGKTKTPVIHLNAKRSVTNMISAITNQGKVRFRVFEGDMNTDILIDFCKRLTKSAKRKVYLILDNLRVHHAKVFKAWLQEHEGEIEVFYLPYHSSGTEP